MNKTILKGISAGVLVASFAAIPAFALTTGLSAAANINATATAGSNTVGVGANTNVSLGARFNNIVTRANQEITRRITALNNEASRVNAMVKLSTAEKGSLAANIQTEISAMNALQAKITADAAANNTSTLVTDVKSITSSYRVFALVMPQAAIESASDRVLTTASIMADLSTKLSARITAAQTAGNNVNAATSALADMNAKITDSNTQANAAATEVSNLTPDNGNATVMASNTAALKDARAKVVASQKDLLAARADAQAIIKALASYKVSANASATVSSSVQ
jgi:hypothetical protein